MLCPWGVAAGAAVAPAAAAAGGVVGEGGVAVGGRWWVVHEDAGFGQQVREGVPGVEAEEEAGVCWCGEKRGWCVSVMRQCYYWAGRGKSRVFVTLL